MTKRAAAVFDIWRRRDERTVGDRAFIAYALVLVGLIVVAPVVRATWIGLSTQPASATLTSPMAPSVAAFLLAASWSTALLVGRRRGPAVLAPILVHVLADSDVPRIRAFGRVVSLSTACVAFCFAGLAGLVGSATLGGDVGAIGPVVDFVVRGAAFGAVAAVLWLLGEAVPRASTWAAGAVLLLGGVALVSPDRPLWAWAWVRPEVVPLTTLVTVVIALAALTSVPALLERVEPARLSEQAAAWDTAVAHAVSLDLSSASGAYHALPSRGRNLSAVVTSRSVAVLVLVRDLVAVVRTPERLLTGVLLSAAGGGLLVVGAVSGPYGALLGVGAAVLVYSGTGSLSAGLYHAARVASDLPLYGVRDGVLLLCHGVLPLGASVLVTGAVAAGTGVAAGVPVVALVHAVVLAVAAAVARGSDALRGPTPLFLLTPAPSAMGDPMPVIRVLWAMDSFVLTVLVGSAVGAGSVVGAGAIAVILLLVVLVVRWAQRP